MQGLVTLDFGNSHPHAGIFNKVNNKWELIKNVPWNELSLFLNQLELNPQNTSLVLCEVKAREDELSPLLEQGYLLTRIKDYWRGQKFAGMPVNYSNTLGEDRLIQAWYTFKKEKNPTLLIDAGTYVTMDIIDQTGFNGGYIIPGQKNYYDSFSKGELLQNVILNTNISASLPHDTQSAMQDSYYSFVLLAKNLIEKNNIKKVILTGGNGQIWSHLLADLEIEIILSNDYIHWSILHWMTTQIEPL
ncbi:MAG: type III pantothenate kinase [Bacteriovoracaceae bacterium]